MSPNHCRRFSAVLSVLGIPLVCYSLCSEVPRVIAADNPRVTETKPSETGMIEVPGSFKDLPEAKDEITSKRASANTLVERAPLSVDNVTIDADKGVLALT